MKVSLNRLLALSFLAINACQNGSNHHQEPSDSSQPSAETAEASPVPLDSVYTEHNQESAQLVASLIFPEAELHLHGLSLTEALLTQDLITADTVFLSEEFGQNIEGKLITASSNVLNDLSIAQCYQTKLSILNDGAQCELSELKTYTSEWRFLQPNAKGEYAFESYSAADKKKFVAVKLAEVKEAIKTNCQEHWHPLANTLRSPTAYPMEIQLSEYYLRLTGRRKDNGYLVEKIIVITASTGC
jgi:hypothetical protein